MSWTPFKKTYKKSLGIDIGTFSIKIVELSGKAERPNLENYSSLPLQAFPESFKSSKKNIFLLSSSDISTAIKAMLKEAKISPGLSAFSVPDFYSFFTNIELPPMTKEEIPKAVDFEASKHVPVPIDEVVTDWSIVGGNPSNKRKTKIKVILVAVPKEVISQYQEIAKLSELKPRALEAEIFALKRALIKEDKRTIALIDIGAKTTTVSLVDNEVLRLCHSFDISSNQLTQILAKSLNINPQEAEDLKRKKGLKSENIAKILIPTINLMLAEIKTTIQDFSQNKGQEPKLYILAGGTVLLPGLKEYFQDSLKKEVVIANPFSNISYPQVLSPVLKEMGPSFAIATGLALNGLR